MKRILFLVIFISLVCCCLAGADVSDKNAQLNKAAMEGNLTAVQTALVAGADVNAKDSDAGITALWIAAGRGHTEIVKCLLDFKADVNVKASINAKDYTALSIARERGQTDIVQVLEKAGAKE